MSYTHEFIKNLPTSMQQEIINLNSQVADLERKRAELQLPVDIVMSYETVVQNRAEAAKILKDAKAEAQELLDSVLVESNQRITKAQESADAVVANANKLLRESATIKNSVLKSLIDADVREEEVLKKEADLDKALAVLDAKVQAFKQQVQVVITALD